VADALEDLVDNPDEEHLDPSTAGNAGISMDRWYHMAGLIIDLYEEEPEGGEEEEEDSEEERKHKKVELHPE
jgi:hypothetical protein